MEEVTCTVCDGDGFGDEECEECDGMGYVEILQRDDTVKEVICSWCDGTGLSTCPDCGGTGLMRDV